MSSTSYVSAVSFCCFLKYNIVGIGVPHVQGLETGVVVLLIIDYKKRCRIRLVIDNRHSVGYARLFAQHRTVNIDNCAYVIASSYSYCSGSAQ